MASQQINVLYFGHLVSMLGRESEVMFLPLTVKDIQALMAHLARRGDQWQSLFSSPPPGLKITVNKQFAAADTPVKGGDEIAFVAFNMA